MTNFFRVKQSGVEKQKDEVKNEKDPEEQKQMDAKLHAHRHLVPLDATSNPALTPAPTANIFVSLLHVS